MPHPRELISQAVVALLTAANTAAGSRVYATRTDPHKKSGIPAIAVYALNDPANDDASSEMEDAHDLELEVAIWAAPGAINDLADQIQIALRADPYLGGLASDIEHTGTAVDPIETDGSAVAVLTYSVAYHIPLDAT